MRYSLGIVAITLGVIGALLCTSAIVLGWWAATKSIERIDRIAARLDHGLSQADMRLARVEARLNSVRSEFNEIRKGAEAIVAENPELPRFRAEIEKLFDRLVPALDRVDAIGDSFGSVAAGLRTTADIVDQFDDDRPATARVRNAADSIDHAAETLHGLRSRVDASMSAKAIRMTRELFALAREAAAGSERLAEGIAAARHETVVVRDQAAEWRGEVAFWVRVGATANTLVWFWGALGQLCLIGWGRRRVSNRAHASN